MSLFNDPDTGVFTWNIYRGRLSKAGSVAGTTRADGYRRIRILGRQYPASIIANLYMEGFIPENQMDHKNRIRDDDKWLNLREASNQCQSRNRGLFKTNKSGVTGVLRRGDKWIARVTVDYKEKHLGTFDKKEDAVFARLAAEHEYKFSNCSKRTVLRKRL